MKRITSLTLIIMLGIVSCSPIKQERYQNGTYTAVNSGCGYIVTADGNVWGFYDRSISSGSSVPSSPFPTRARKKSKTT